MYAQPVNNNSGNTGYQQPTLGYLGSAHQSTFGYSNNTGSTNTGTTNNTNNAYGNVIQTYFSYIQEQLKEIFEVHKTLKEVKESIKEMKVVNINNNMSTSTEVKRTQTSVLMRKALVQGKQLPMYVVMGKGFCDKCGVSELVHGIHYENMDFCIECYGKLNSNDIKFPDNLVEFSV